MSTPPKEDLAELVALSRHFGSDPEYVLAGGGNTSFKTESRLFIKGSGTALADIEPAGFVRLDRARLASLWRRDYPADPHALEALVTEVLLAAREPGQEAKRPSVETPLHDFFPEAYVAHTHPALINALACSRRGAEAVRELLGAEVLWIPTVNPGFQLAATVRREMESFSRRHGRSPDLLVLQNHGLCVAGRDFAEVRRKSEALLEKVRARVPALPDLPAAAARPGPCPGRRAGPRRAHAAAGGFPLLGGDLRRRPAHLRLPGRFDRLHPRPRGLLQPRGAAGALGRAAGGALPASGERHPGLPRGPRTGPQDRRGRAPGGLRLGAQPQERGHRPGGFRGRPEGGLLRRVFRRAAGHAGGAGALHPGLGGRGPPPAGQRRAGPGRPGGREDRPGDRRRPGLRPGHCRGPAGRRGQRGPGRPQRGAGPGAGRGAGPPLRGRARAGRARRRDRRGLGGPAGGGHRPGLRRPGPAGQQRRGVEGRRPGGDGLEPPSSSSTRSTTRPTTWACATPPAP